MYQYSIQLYHKIIKFLILQQSRKVLKIDLALATICTLGGVKATCKDPSFAQSLVNLQIRCGNFQNGLFLTYKFYNTQPVWTLFLFKSIWTRPQGSQGCPKIRFMFLQIKLLSFCANIAPERHKLRKIIKIGKKCQKTPVFLDFFEYSSIWGQY